MSGTKESPEFSFVDLPAKAYPFVVEAFLWDADYDAEPVWSETVTGPGALRIPPLAREHGKAVRVHVRWADSTEEIFWPECKCGHAMSDHPAFGMCIRCRPCGIYRGHAEGLEKKGEKNG